MRVLFVFPSAEFSTYDVARGLNRALKAAGEVEIVDYMLSRRIQMASLGLHAMYGGTEDEAPHVASLVHGSEGIVHNALLRGCEWILFVNGMGLHPDALLAVKRAGLKVAGVFTEAPYDTNEQAELRLAQFCDVAFVTERTAVGSFSMCPVAVHLPHAYDPEVHRPAAAVEAEHDVVFIGTGFAERQILFEMIDWTGIDLALGGMWQGVMAPSFLARHKRWGCMSNDDTAAVYGRAKIVLNPHRNHPTAESANPRVLEAAACGLFQIASYRREIEEMFGDAVPTYRPGVPWELEALARYYLAHPEERAAKAARALELVQGHTFEERARIVATTLASFGAGSSEGLLPRPLATVGG